MRAGPLLSFAGVCEAIGPGCVEAAFEVDSDVSPLCGAGVVVTAPVTREASAFSAAGASGVCDDATESAAVAGAVVDCKASCAKLGTMGLAATIASAIAAAKRPFAGVGIRSSIIARGVLIDASTMIWPYCTESNHGTVKAFSEHVATAH